MTTLLKITTSLFSSKGQSSQLTDAFVTGWQAANPEGRLITRDLGADPIPHLTGDGFLGFRAAPEARTPAQLAVVAYSDKLIDEIKAADIIALGLPMYNFGVPSSLKCYFDHVARAGVTFRYTDKGPVGLLPGKKAYILAARGGRYAGTTKDSQTAYVREFLNLIGVADVEFVYAEGLNVNESVRAEAMSKARGEIERIAQCA